MGIKAPIRNDLLCTAFLASLVCAPMVITCAGARALLGVPPCASGKTIREAYLREVLRTHPDKGGDQDHFRKVQDAYRVLSAQQQISPAVFRPIIKRPPLSKPPARCGLAPAHRANAKKKIFARSDQSCNPKDMHATRVCRQLGTNTPANV